MIIIQFLTSRLGGWVVGGLAALIMFGLWQLSSSKVDMMKEREKVYLSNEVTLKSAIESQQSAVQLLKDMNSANMAQLADYEADGLKHQKITEALRNEINDLRSTEEGQALKEPYERGIAAGARLNRIMQRFTKDRNGQNNIDPNTEPTNDPSRTPDDGNQNTQSSGDDT